MSSDFDDLYRMLAAAFNLSPEQMKAEAQAKQQRAAQRAAAQDERYREAFKHITAPQAQRVAELRQAGAKLQSSLRQHRVSGNVVLFLQRQLFDPARGRIATKLYAVYPDGNHAETFERTISVRADF